MRVRPFRAADWNEWRRMTEGLFPGLPPDEYEQDMRAFRAVRDAEVFIAERPDGSACGYVEVGIRPYAEGCRTSPVGYIEAWYVDDDVRREGYGRALLSAAEDWAKGRGYQEMASDALIDNTVSLKAHTASGYEVVERLVTFRKPLT